MLRLALFSLMFVLLSGCFPGPALRSPVIRADKDDFQGSTWLNLEDNQVGSCDRSGIIELNAQRFTNRAAQTYYWLGVSYVGDGWVFLRQGRSLTLLIDGQRVILENPDDIRPRREVLSGSRVWESIRYAATIEIFGRIAQAKEVRFQAIGDRDNIECTLSESNRKGFGNFVAAITQ